MTLSIDLILCASLDIQLSLSALFYLSGSSLFLFSVNFQPFNQPPNLLVFEFEPLAVLLGCDSVPRKFILNQTQLLPNQFLDEVSTLGVGY